jgi:hypothetical protein
MHALIIVVVWLALALAPAPAHAQEAEALRRELEQLRRQQEQYQKAIEALSERLKRLESQPAPVATPPGAPAPGGIAQTPAPPAAPSTPSLVDLARPREPFALYGQRGGGQLLFDIGLAGDFVANLTQHNVDKANAGTFAGRENRFFPREVELSLFGQIDPYARAEVRIEAGEEEPGAETGVSLAEANLTLLTLPWGTQLKLGQMRARFGYVNQIHDHDLPWIDRPNACVTSWARKDSPRRDSRRPSSPTCPSTSKGWSASSTGTTTSPSATGSSASRSSPRGCGPSWS